MIRSIWHRWFTLLALSVFATIAQARTWTNQDGKQIEADYVSVDEERVTLRLAEGREVKIKIATLSSDDQIFLQAILLKRKAKNATITTDDDTNPSEAASDLSSSSLPKAESHDTDDADDEPKSLAKSSSPKKKKYENRVWNDRLGNKMTAKFIRMQGSSVMVLKAGRATPVDYFTLSTEDQEYLKTILEEAGTPELIPTPPVVNNPNNALAGNMGAPNMAPPNMAMPISPAPNMNPGPRPSYPSPNMSASTAGGYSPPGMRPNRPPTYSAPSMPPSSSTATYNPPMMPSSPNMAPAYSSPPPMMSSSGGTRSSYNPPMHSFVPTYQRIKKCSRCMKQVPSHLSAGDSCPHCGTYFGRDDTNGRTAALSAYALGRIIGGGMITLIILGVIGTVIRKITGG